MGVAAAAEHVPSLGCILVLDPSERSVRERHLLYKTLQSNTSAKREFSHRCCSQPVSEQETCHLDLMLPLLLGRVRMR